MSRPTAFPALLAALLAGGLAPLAANAAGWTVDVLVPPAPLHGANGMQFDREGRLVGGSMMSGTLFRVDRQTGAVETLVEAPRGVADDMAIAPDGTLAWTSPPMGTISMLRPGGTVETLARDLPMINSIFFAPDGRLFAAAVSETIGNLYEIDMAREKPPRVVVKDLPGLNGFEVTRDNVLFGPLMYTGQVIRVDLATGAVTEVARGFDRPTAVNLDSKGRLYVVDYLTGEVTRVDPATGAKTRIAKTDPPVDNLAVSPDDLVYVSHPCTRGIEEIDPQTGTVRTVAAGSIGWPGGGTMVRERGRDLLLVPGLLCNNYVDPDTGAVTRVPRQGDTMWSGWIDRRGATIVLSSFAFGQVQWLDARTGKPIRTLTGFKAPYAVKLMADDSVLLAEYGTGRILRLRRPYKEPEVVAAGLGGPLALAVDGDSLIVSEADAGIVAEIRIATGERRVLRSGLAPARGPRAAARRPHRHRRGRREAAASHRPRRPRRRQGRGSHRDRSAHRPAPLHGAAEDLPADRRHCGARREDFRDIRRESHGPADQPPYLIPSCARKLRNDMMKRLPPLPAALLAALAMSACSSPPQLPPWRAEALLPALPERCAADATQTAAEAAPVLPGGLSVVRSAGRDVILVAGRGCVLTVDAATGAAGAAADPRRLHRAHDDRRHQLRRGLQQQPVRIGARHRHGGRRHLQRVRVALPARRAADARRQRAGGRVRHRADHAGRPGERHAAHARPGRPRGARRHRGRGRHPRLRHRDAGRPGNRVPPRPLREDHARRRPQAPRRHRAAARGRLVVAEVGLRRLIEVDPATRKVEVLADSLPVGLTTNAGADDPYAITDVAAAADGTIFVSSDIDRSILRLTPQPAPVK